ncbi:siderophore-interacting protein [Taibaiella koreensis]|uniref:siderophore-interacting protein n=1 Tax=Taibaiella koreensis TaxID=1268548 RepID=UPI0013C2E4C9|nr:siderophore-interacting protein [Taibaiella koreensis]
MPSVPKWLGNMMETVFSGNFTSVVADQVSTPAEGLKLIRFKGDFSRSNIAFVPGQKIEFRVNDTDYRHYTPAYFNKEEGICDVLFYLHDQGPGSRWAGLLQPGEETKLMGPGGRMRFDRRAGVHILYGDETSLGLFQCIATEAANHKLPYFCIAEMDSSHQHWAQLIPVKATAVVKHAAFKAYNAKNLFQEWLQDYQGPKEEMAFYLSGDARALQEFRKGLLNMGFKSSQVQSDPYWAEGKRGL